MPMAASARQCIDGRPSEIDYDPADLVPTCGGPLGTGTGRGPLDQALVESRSDVLVFTSDVIEEDLEVTGRICVRLHVQSSAPSTDSVARPLFRNEGQLDVRRTASIAKEPLVRGDELRSALVARVQVAVPSRGAAVRNLHQPGQAHVARRSISIS
ncbi:CocE/NonD family hydrolase C-terminal non-catalytic domain-containing protein [Streptomyces sp. NPDC048430]|uniref:CocE/NonD family hydrolase C-terminal non-catalytic domain-containing protein n=1 Tax=Streptomyces sp. NPDC048430 TaxID=3155388 RepID=UPI00341715B6